MMNTPTLYVVFSVLRSSPQSIHWFTKEKKKTWMTLNKWGNLLIRPIQLFQLMQRMKSIKDCKISETEKSFQSSNLIILSQFWIPFIWWTLKPWNSGSLDFVTWCCLYLFMALVVLEGSLFSVRIFWLPLVQSVEQRSGYSFLSLSHLRLDTKEQVWTERQSLLENQKWN